MPASELTTPSASASTRRPGARIAGPILAAAVVAAGAAPGLLTIPALDRDEARFAQSSAQMLESGDFIDPRFQDAPRDKKPAGVNWLQAASIKLASRAEARRIWAYRLPSLLGAMLAAAALAWGAQAFFAPWRAASAGVVLGCGWLLSSEAAIAKADALLCGGVALAMAALAHIYAAARRGDGARGVTRSLLWIGLGLAVMVKGPVGPAVIGSSALMLWALDRRAPWAGRMSWRWGLLFLLALVGPWAAAITVSSDGGFWVGSLGGDVAAKLSSVREGHRGPPGVYLALLPALAFPATALLPGAAAYAWRYRNEAAARFALACIAPMWLVFEFAPTKLPHYTLPLYGGVALLAAGSLSHGGSRALRWSGAALSGLAALILAGVTLELARRFGGGWASGWSAGIVAAMILAAGAAGAVGVLTVEMGRRLSWLCAALALGVGAHAAASGWLLPSLTPLWTSRRAAELLDRAGLDPRNGVTPGPVAVAGYAEPSLVFRLGTDTDLGDGDDAALAVESGRPALVEARAAPSFLARLRKDGVAAKSPGQVRGFDYSDGRQVALRLWIRR